MEMNFTFPQPGYARDVMMKATAQEERNRILLKRAAEVIT